MGVRIFWLLMAALTVAFLAWMGSDGYWLSRTDGSPRVADVAVYWTAAHLVLSGDVSTIYDAQAFHALEEATVKQHVDASLLYNYPPTSLLFIWPLGLVSYVAAWLVTEAVGATIWILVLHRIVRDWLLALGMAIALGGATIALFEGQNGFFTASLLVGSLLALPRDKRLSGILLGLLSFKPQLAGPALLGFLLWREWRAVGWSIITGGAMILLATIVFGFQPWLDLFHASPGFASIHAGRVVAETESRMQTVLSLTAPHLGFSGAFVLQLLVGAAALFATTRVTGDDQRSAALIAAVVLVTPFAYLYDLTALMGATALLLRNSRSRLETAVICTVGSFPAVWFVSLGQVGTISAFLLLTLAYNQSQVGFKGKAVAAS